MEVAKAFYSELEKGIANLKKEDQEKLYRPCAESCMQAYVLKEQQRQFEECHGDMDLQYEKYGHSEYFFGEIIEPGRVYEMGYPKCFCPMVEQGYVTDPVHCECSRQSILYILKELQPEKQFKVEPIHTVLSGAKECRFRVEVI